MTLCHDLPPSHSMGLPVAWTTTTEEIKDSERKHRIGAGAQDLFPV